MGLLREAARGAGDATTLLLLDTCDEGKTREIQLATFGSLDVARDWLDERTSPLVPAAYKVWSSLTGWTGSTTAAASLAAWRALARASLTQAADAFSEAISSAPTWTVAVSATGAGGVGVGVPYGVGQVGAGGVLVT
ncbi:hypothetical protein ACIQOW_20875 [Kitasatospora sp. NPDC091335]|uniref:hypothetical protein n=1 Tax=Kitasatospora sp. NPDC091335 TaxID=3364085 RepID=UPI00381DA0B6